MKLRAIRLKEFRRFSEAVTIEGLSGKLDVLAAPNEDGKSTLFEAVRTVISEKYNAGAGSKKMKAIQPYAGGAPLIEIDFDLDGREYRLRKQFVKKPDAILTDRTTGRDIARKDDVEDWLNDHLKTRLPFGLFWVAQHGAATPAAMDKNAGEHASALRSAVEAEVGAIAGGAVRDAVRRSIADDLGTLVTSRGPKKNSAYDQALQARKSIEADIAAARQRRQEAEVRYERLEALREERQDVLSSSNYSALDARLEAAQKSVDEAQHANRQLREARKEQEASEHQVAALTQQLADFDGRANDFAALSTEQAEASRVLSSLLEEITGAEVAFEQAHTTLAESQETLSSLREEERMAALVAQRATLAKDIDRRTSVLGEGRDTALRIDHAETFLAQETVTVKGAQTLQTLMGEVAALALQAEQQIPKITVTYEPGAEGRIHADGQTLAGGLPRQIRDKTDLAVDGVGRISVDPGAARDRVEDADDLKACQNQRDTLMDTLGVTSLKEAQKRAADRDALAAALKLDQKRLLDLAPDGFGVLETGLKETQSKLATLPGVEDGAVVRSRDDVVADIALLEPKIKEQSQILEERRSAVQALKERRAAADADIKARADRLETLADSLDRDGAQQPVGRDANRLGLSGKVDSAQSRLNEGTRAVSVWLDAFVNDEKLSALKVKLSDIQKEVAVSQAALRRVDQERGEIEAVLRETTSDGIDEVIGGLEGTLERSEKDVAYHVRRVAALRLLADTLDDVAEETRATYTKPIVERLTPYVEAIFPGADFSFTEQFSSREIQREGAAENFDDVSMGTQEQIGVLIRLGFARLFADRGQPLPLILDDALVYSDDQRIEKMFDALRLAAQQHQVLILTCRMKAFENLGGNRLAIAPCKFG